jgi:DNA-binding GntR family transcriptional regulator
MEKELPIPYYLRVAETLLGRILANHYNQGDLIPSYRLLKKSSISVSLTVRKAVEIFVQDGNINHKRGIA